MFVSLAGAVAIAVLAVWIGRTLIERQSSPDPARHPAAAPATTTTTLPPPSTAADIAAFLAAERRMLLGTWAIQAQFVRQAPSGHQLVSDIRRAQRPPDTLNQGPATATLRRNGRLVSCASGPTGGLVCKDTGPAPAFTDEVNGELDDLRSYVVASVPLYSVVAAPGAGPGQCWRFLLAVPNYPSPPYGTEAVFCFDPATGAPSYSQVVRPQATDTTRVLSISGTVTNADLTVEATSPPPTQPPTRPTTSTTTSPNQVPTTLPPGATTTTTIGVT